MKKKTLLSALGQNFFFGLALLILIAVFASIALQNYQAPKTIDIAGLAQKISAHEVKTVVVGSETITATLKDGTVLESQKEAGVDATQIFTNLGVSSAALADAKFEIKKESSLNYWMAVMVPTLIPILIIGAIFYFVMRGAKGGMNEAFSFGRANLKLFTNFKDRVTFADVAGLEEPKQELYEVVDFLKNPKKFIDMGAKIPRGVLLMGPPGSGKTLLARAVAGEAGVPFFHISASEFVEMFVGVGAARIRDMFATAKRTSPSILFIDEIDAIGRERGTGLGGGHDEREQTLNQILVEMDGFDNTTHTIVLAATNRPDVLDQALLRPGRFDRHVIIDFPDIREREQILAIHGKNKHLAETVDFKKIATRTPGFSGADLANLVNEAAILAVRHDKKIIDQNDLYESIEKVMMGPARRSKIVTEKEKQIAAYHEAGHAIVAAGLTASDPIHKISIISRGRAGGYTLKLPDHEEHYRTKSQFMADMAMAMGGCVAEKLTFQESSTGASSDLEHASGIARAIVTRYGMSDKIGHVAFAKTPEHVFLGREISTERNYSETMATKIDEEVKKFIDDAYATATKILQANPELLKKVADALIEKEVLEQEDFYAIVKESGLKKILM